MQTPTANNKLIFQHYLVAFLDLVGQRDILRKLLTIPSGLAEEQEFIATVRQSLGKVLELRRDFEKFFAEATRDEDLSRYPVEFHEAMRACMQTKHTIFGLSDAIVIAVPLGGDDDNEYCRAMNSVRLAFLSICGLAMRAFAIGMVFRGGLDVGIGTHIEETNEIYGSALVRAYQLEAEVAEYPRFVIGAKLLDFIKIVQDQIPKTIFGKLATYDANSCRKMIVQDTDGRQMLDFLGVEVKNVLEPSLSPELFSLGHDFIQGEYKRFCDLGQEKLTSRYFRLLQYYLARKKVWRDYK